MGQYRNRATLIRIALDVVLAAAVLVAPWWITVLVALVLLAHADAPEVVVAGLAMDALYGTPVPAFGTIDVLFTVGFAALAIAAWYVKRHLLAYETATF